MSYPQEPEAWLHLGDCLKAERNGRSVAEIERLSGVSHTTIELYETGKMYKEPPPKMWQLVNFYRWTPGSMRRVLGGQSPQHLTVTADDMKRLVRLVKDSPILTAGEREELVQDMRSIFGL